MSRLHRYSWASSAQWLLMDPHTPPAQTKCGPPGVALLLTPQARHCGGIQPQENTLITEK